MKTRLPMAPLLMAALLTAVPAGANPSLPPTLIPHYAPEIAWSIEPPEGGWSGAYNAHPVHRFEDLHLRIDVEGAHGVVWFVLGAMSFFPEWCGVEFGLGAYDVTAFVPTSFGPCFPSQGLEYPYAGWPGPESGIALVTTDIPWEGNFEPLYCFAGYVYAEAGPTVIPIVPNPSTGMAGIATCTNPPSEFTIYALGCLGINMEGSMMPMQFRACCRDSVCTVETQIGCETGGGAWIPDQFDCSPGLCTTPIREVTWGEIKALYKN